MPLNELIYVRTKKQGMAPSKEHRRTGDVAQVLGHKALNSKHLFTTGERGGGGGKERKEEGRREGGKEGKREGWKKRRRKREEEEGGGRRKRRRRKEEEEEKESEGEARKEGKQNAG
jgi:hypothetical protein